MTEKEFMSWPEFNHAVMELAMKVDAIYDIDVVVGVARGGLPGAVTLSHALDAEMSVVWATHPRNQDGSSAGEVEVENYGLEKVDTDTTVLLFDDIVDTGRTMQEITHKWDVNGVIDFEWHAASIHRSPDPEWSPYFWLHETEKWIVYPWEVSL